MITVSDKAKTYLTEQLDQSHHHFVRLSVRGGGCAGFSYDYEFCDATEPLDFKVDIDEDKDASDQNKVEAVPTFVFFNKGNMVNRIDGAFDVEKIDEIFAGQKA